MRLFPFSFSFFVWKPLFRIIHETIAKPGGTIAKTNVGRFPKITRPSGISIAIASTNKTTPNAT
ncbi:MAG: hypothetical protein ACOC35_01630, partial [Promethearchaeia archaeon]